MHTNIKRDIHKRMNRYIKNGNSALVGLFEALLIIEEDKESKKINKKKPCKKVIKK